MYTVVTRRKMNEARQQETVERARSEFFPKLQAAPGFVGFYLVRDADEGMNCAIAVWQDKASAEAFQPELNGWTRVLDEMGHRQESVNRGDTVVNLEGQR